MPRLVVAKSGRIIGFPAKYRQSDQKRQRHRFLMRVRPGPMGFDDSSRRFRHAVVGTLPSRGDRFEQRIPSRLVGFHPSRPFAVTFAGHEQDIT